MLHTALLVGINPLVHRRCALVYHSLQLFRAFHGQQVHACETAAGTAKWYPAMTAGSSMAPSWILGISSSGKTL